MTRFLAGDTPTEYDFLEFVYDTFHLSSSFAHLVIGQEAFVHEPLEPETRLGLPSAAQWLPVVYK